MLESHVARSIPWTKAHDSGKPPPLALRVPFNLEDPGPEQTPGQLASSQSFLNLWCAPNFRSPLTK